MTGLELELRVEQFNRNAKTAADSLKAVGDQAVTTQTMISTAAGKMTNAFAVGTSGISAASSIASTANAMKSLNTEMAVLSGSRALLELGRLGGELGTLSTSGGAVGRVLGGLGSIAARTGPWIALAGAVVSVGSAFFSMGEKADDATQSINKQAQAIDALIAKSRGLNIAAGYGAADPRTTSGGTIEALTALRTTTNGNPITGANAAGLYGLSEFELRRIADLAGISGATARRQVPFVDPANPRQIAGYADGPDYQRESFSRSELVQTGEYLLRQRRAAETPSPYRGDRGYGTGDLLRTGSTNYGLDGFSGVSINVEQQATVTRDNERRLQQQREQEQQALEAARELQRITDQIGGTLGDAAADFALGLANARQAAQGLLSDFIRAGFRTGFQGLASAIGGGTGETFKLQP